MSNYGILTETEGTIAIFCEGLSELLNSHQLTLALHFIACGY